MYLAFGLGVLITTLLSNGYANGESISTVEELANFLPDLRKDRSLSNSEIWKNIPTATLDKFLDSLLKKAEQLDEKTFLGIVKSKLILDGMGKCDCENLRYIDVVLTYYLTVRGKSGTTKKPVGRASAEKPGEAPGDKVDKPKG